MPIPHRCLSSPRRALPTSRASGSITKPGGHLLTDSGSEPPLNAAGKAEYARRQAALKSGDHKIDPVSTCLMHGIPRLLYAPYPFLILQTTRNVNFVHEVNHTFRNHLLGQDAAGGCRSHLPGHGRWRISTARRW